MTQVLLKTLYCEQHLSMMEIATRLNTTQATVLYWLKKHGIARRSWSESTYAKLNPHGDPFRIQPRLTHKRQALLRAALMLYWAEGSKTQGGTHIGNLDPRMLQIFVKFLREVCHVREERISMTVRVHRRFSLRAAKRYWSAILKIHPSRVLVYWHNDRRSKANKQWSPYGIAKLQFHSVPFKRWLMAQIEQHLRELLEEEGRLGSIHSLSRAFSSYPGRLSGTSRAVEGATADQEFVFECDALSGYRWLEHSGIVSASEAGELPT